MFLCTFLKSEDNFSHQKYHLVVSSRLLKIFCHFVNHYKALYPSVVVLKGEKKWLPCLLLFTGKAPSGSCKGFDMGCSHSARLLSHSWWSFQGAAAMRFESHLIQKEHQLDISWSMELGDTETSALTLSTGWIISTPYDTQTQRTAKEPWLS